MASPYPYYARWDSSQVYTLDALIVGSGNLPDHLFHPNMVPLVFEKYIILPLGKIAGFLSVTSITELDTIPNPYLPFAETAEYLLDFNYIYMTIFLVLMYLAIFRLFSSQLNERHGLSKQLLIVTLTGLSLVWMYIPVIFIWIRYETVGLALWSLGFYSTIRASKKPNRLHWLIVAGLCSGAAVLSKIQLVAGVAILPFLYVYLLENKPLPPDKNYRWLCISLLCFSSIFIILLHYLAYIAFKNNSLPCVAFSSTIKAMNWWPFAPVGTLILFIAGTGILTNSSRWPFIAALMARTAVFISAFVSVLLLSLTLGNSWEDKSNLLYWTYIFSYGLGQRAFIEATGYIKPVDWGNYFFTFSLSAFAILALIISYITAKNRISPIKLVSVILLLLATVLVIIVFTRPLPMKDGMLYTTWATVASIVAWHCLLTMHRRFSFVLVGCILAWLWIGWQVLSLSNFHETHLSPNRNYVTNKWMNFSYGCRGRACLFGKPAYLSGIVCAMMWRDCFVPALIQ